MNEKLLLIVGGKSTALEIFEVASSYYCDRYSKIHFLIGDSERKSGDNQIFDSEIKLKSGGYLVINPTEALVSIDINSGSSIKGKNVENTALDTNIEAAEEIARQIKIRDLSGLIIIDFIDMLNYGNRRLV